MKHTPGVDLGKCNQKVRGEGQWGSFYPHQCCLRGKVVREGKVYCTKHDPIYIQEKRKVELKNWEKRTKFEEANARLIAAAPELLETLKAIRILHLESYKEGTIGKNLSILIEQTIAKAEGVK